MVKFSCPIKQPQSHCSICHFLRAGKCGYEEAKKELDKLASRITSREMMNTNDSLARD